MKQDENKR